MEMRISNALKMLAEKVAEAGDKELPLLLNAAANEIKQLKTQHDYFKNGMAELQDYIDKMDPELLALRAKAEQLKNELTLSTDQNDLLLDEFVRVKLLTDNEEIHGLCERAHVRMRQKVSVIDRNFKQAEEIKQLKVQVEQLCESAFPLCVDYFDAFNSSGQSLRTPSQVAEHNRWLNLRNALELILSQHQAKTKR